ncbi:MAG: hypothetical protein ABMB14_32215, partial [Myxococcota bacterium]
MRTTIVVWLAALAANAEQPSAVLTDFGAEATAMTTPATPTARTPARSTLSAEARGARTKAVGWLLAHQKSDGGWASGSFGTSGAESASDAATTAFAVLALHREGAHPVEVRRGVEWVLRAVETAPEGPRLNTPEGTQIQYKLGALVDTHLASLMLGEVAPSLPAPLQSRARTALATCVRK